MPEFIGGLKEMIYAAYSFWDFFCLFKELSHSNKALLLE
jgi:hypothetical protein